MAIGVRLAADQMREITGEITGKKLRAITQKELDIFNDDLMNIAAHYGMDAIRAAVEEYQEEILLLVRQVMEQANAPYGGSGARGAEICMRALRPIDVGIAADIWDTDYTAVVVGTATNREQTFINADTMGEEEGNILLGALNEHGDQRVVNAYRWMKNQINYPALTLPFPYCDTDRASFVKFQAPIIQFTEEALTFYWNVVRAQFAYVGLVGVHATRAQDVANTYS